MAEMGIGTTDEQRQALATLFGILEPEGITSDIDAYTDGSLGLEDYQNLAKVLLERTEAGSPEREAAVAALYDSGLITSADSPQARAYWTNGTLESLGEDVTNLGNSMYTVITGVDAETGEAAPLPGDDVVGPAGKTDEYPGIMDGGTIHRINNPDQEDYFVVAYEYPPGSGHSFYYRFDNRQQLEAAIGPNMGGGSVPIGAPMDEAVVRQWTDAGDSNEVVGASGSFGAFIDDIIWEAGQAAGLADPTILGDALRDPGIQLLLAKAAEGDWTETQTKAAMRNEPYYKDVLYPGIEHLYGASDNPEAQYAILSQNFGAGLKELGIARDPDGTYKSQIAGLLEAGVSDVAFAAFVPAYKKASTSTQYASNLSKWTQQIAGVSVESFEDWFDVIAGNAPAEIQEIAELATLSTVANQQGLGISDQAIQNIGDDLDLSEGQARSIFSQTGRNLLALGASGLRRGGLTVDDIVQAEAGIGGNAEKLKSRVRKFAVEEGLADDMDTKYFTDYNQYGAPVKAGLKSTAIEGA